ncbi:MAG TPA: hypothetical protein ENJ56_07060, partial [Anaerolineae bacterium]|nr:hypothetical protein [Anaerolineae bacterium]
MSESFTTRRGDQLRQPDTVWQDVVTFGWDLLATVGGETWPEQLAEQGYQVQARAFAMPLVRKISFNVNVERVYAALAELEQLPELLVNYVADDQLTRIEPYHLPDWLAAAMGHLGSISAEFPLSPSQREALYNFLLLPPGTILPINGPPGTGKTTLLQSVVASLWVEAALADSEPPLIAVASTNNQAVTNVIESFGRLSTIERWLPVPSFALYLVNSRDKQATATQRGFLWTDRKGNGFPKNLLNGDGLARLTNNFLDQCEAEFGVTIESVEAAVLRLHNALKRKALQLHHGLQVAYAAAYAAAEQARRLDAYGGFARRRSFLVQAIGEKSAELSTLSDLYTAWQTHLGQIDWWQAPVKFLPSIKREHTERNRAFVALHLPTFEGIPSTAAVNAWFADTRNQLESELADLYDQRNILQAEADGMNEALLAWEQWRQQLHAPACDLATLLDPTQQTHPLFDWLDVTLRHELLQWATHYWEGRWLLAAHEPMDDLRSQTGQLAHWQRNALLTPCFVTTLQSGPAFFEYDDEDLGERQPFFALLDLLIIDEAGQVLPEVAGAMFALAQQALVVGDTKQIEPIWNVPRAIDIDNLYSTGLLEEQAEMRHPYLRAMCASKGSVMTLAQFQSPFQKRNWGGIRYQPGMFLAEHRRSVPQIIAYCNELAYGGALKPVRPPLQDYPWPHLGMVAVGGGSAEIIGSS